MNEVVAPLDAYATAKPDEPTFTLQGGDPLAAPMVRIWALAARVRAGVTPLEALVAIASSHKLMKTCQETSVAHDDRERENLLLRATKAEEVSWSMDDYAKGVDGADQPSQAANTHLDELARIDLHDTRVRAASRINNMVAELTEIDEALMAHGFEDHRVLQAGRGDIVDDLKALSGIIEPRRLFKKDNPHAGS